MQGFCDVFVGAVVLRVCLLRDALFPLTGGQFFLEELNDVHVGAGNLCVVIFDILILLVVLGDHFLDFVCLLCLDLLDLLLPLPLHSNSQIVHQILVLELDLITDSLMI